MPGIEWPSQTGSALLHYLDCCSALLTNDFKEAFGFDLELWLGHNIAKRLLLQQTEVFDRHTQGPAVLQSGGHCYGV